MKNETYADTLLRAAFGRHDRLALQQLAPGATPAVLDTLASKSLSYLRSAQSTDERQWAAHALQTTIAAGARHPDRSLV